MRRLIFALGLAALLWATAGRTSPVPSDDILAMSGAGACAVADDGRGTGDSDQRWRAAHQAIGVVTESLWKSAPVHAGLGASRAAHSFDTVHAVSSPDPPLPSVPHYLRHTPLLI